MGQFPGKRKRDVEGKDSGHTLDKALEWHYHTHTLAKAKLGVRTRVQVQPSPLVRFFFFFFSFGKQLCFFPDVSSFEHYAIITQAFRSSSKWLMNSHREPHGRLETPAC